MPCATGGEYRAFSRHLSDSDQKIAERKQIVLGNYNAGSYAGFHFQAAIKQWPNLWPDVCEGDGGEGPPRVNVKLPDAQSIWNTVWIGYRRFFLRLIGHS